MTKQTTKKLIADGIGLAHFNKDIAHTHKWLIGTADDKGARQEALTWLYRMAFLRGKAKSTREALKIMV